MLYYFIARNIRQLFRLPYLLYTSSSHNSHVLIRIFRSLVTVVQRHDLQRSIITVIYNDFIINNVV